MIREKARAVLLDLVRLPPVQRRAVLLRLPAPARRSILEEWWWQAHGAQAEPEGDWRAWAIVAGRGFGKTRAGAEWVWARARENRDARIALVAATMDEVERVMVEGESGLLSVARCDERARWISTRGLLIFPSGAEAHAFSAERPEKLRGPQHHHAWCDELAKWPVTSGRADAAWDNLMLGLRLGERPRTIVTTTPKRVPLLKRILALPRCADTRGRTADNPHLPAEYREAVEAMYGGTRLGRQELEGLLLEEHEGALWTRAMIEKARERDGFAQRRGDAETNGASCRETASCQASQEMAASPRERDEHVLSAPPRLRANPLNLGRIVIGLDPPASTAATAAASSSAAWEATASPGSSPISPRAASRPKPGPAASPRRPRSTAPVASSPRRTRAAT
jgi:phage terminase large subunit-like protein